MCLVFLADFISVSDLSLVDLFYIFLITLISWGPLLLYKYDIWWYRILKRRFFPTDYEKVMKTVKRRLISKKMPKGSMFSDN